mmetsp:Transcript_2061/g.2828  ORF Transcript_2061/g.2828 Transcript_2061/m.2828 type:complete len:500 (+) Transcript_2061:105-1604(+)
MMQEGCMGISPPIIETSTNTMQLESPKAGTFYDEDGDLPPPPNHKQEKRGKTALIDDTKTPVRKKSRQDHQAALEMRMQEYREESIVRISYEDLLNACANDQGVPAATAPDIVEDTTAQALGQAFGPQGLGILAVTGVPNLVEQRATLLPLARRFAHFDDSIKQLYEHEASFYNVGWSHGKEKLQGGRPDFSKGSFYANPLHDKPFEEEEIIKSQPSFAQPNIWPSAHLPELEDAFKTLGRTIVEVGILIAEQCDRYVNRHCREEAGVLKTIIRNSRCCKARLLHYFPVKSQQQQEEEQELSGGTFADWCGWHNDHGALTGLVPGLYLDDETGSLVELTDPDAGLFICNRKGQIVKPIIPKAALLFQIGETAQVLSGGLLQATPHAVRTGGLGSGVSRESFAVFMEPEWTYPMNPPVRLCRYNENRVTVDEEKNDHLEACSNGNNSDVLPQDNKQEVASLDCDGTDFSQLTGMSPLPARWQHGISFGKFTQNTFLTYYH